MGLVRTVEPTTTPILKAAAKTHLELSASETFHDTYLDDLLASISYEMEQYTGRAWLPQTWVLTLDEFPASNGCLKIPRPPLRAISSIEYVDSDGATQTLSSSLYRVETNATPGSVEPAYNEIWPDTRRISGAVTVTYTAGYDDAASVPANVKHAFRITISNWFENRGESELPESAKRLVASLQTGMHSGAYEVTK